MERISNLSVCCLGPGFSCRNGRGRLLLTDPPAQFGPARAVSCARPPCLPSTTGARLCPLAPAFGLSFYLGRPISPRHVQPTPHARPRARARRTGPMKLEDMPGRAHNVNNGARVEAGKGKNWARAAGRLLVQCFALSSFAKNRGAFSFVWAPPFGAGLARACYLLEEQDRSMEPGRTAKAYLARASSQCLARRPRRPAFVPACGSSSVGQGSLEDAGSPEGRRQRPRASFRPAASLRASVLALREPFDKAWACSCRGLPGVERELGFVLAFLGR
ncbi:unnamed protein product [Amoebophrya sp. A120]|nr:unnamed protein product [Amoebophrya sp. A120]|eukprot:GSA120T00010020001.1